MTALLNDDPHATQQPDIARVLGIHYDDPIPDAVGWAKVFGDVASAPVAPRCEMFLGPIGDLTRVVAPHVPWDPVALHVQLVVALGNYLGFAPHIPEGATLRRPNLFLALVGGTGSGKGSSFAWAEWVLRHLDDRYLVDRTTTAVGSGQGLLAKITDTVFTLNAAGDEVVAIEGSDDKRVLYVEEELGQLFTRMLAQDGIEKMITKAWDSGLLETTTKKESMRCEQPHVSIIGHITPDELFDRLEHRLVDNGFSNRWLYMLIKPTQVKFLEPRPEDVPDLAEACAILTGTIRSFSSSYDGQPFHLTSQAHDLFAATARHMADRHDTGAMAKQTARWRSTIFKFAMIYAAAEGTTAISDSHFLAARATYAYATRSARAFFGSMSGNENVDRFLSMWRADGYRNVTLTDITEMFSRNLTAVKRNAMLDRLRRDGLIAVETRVSSGGRPATEVVYTGGTLAAGTQAETW